jgi:hypothetical protein
VAAHAADSAAAVEAASMVEAAATAVVVDTGNRPGFSRLTAED